MGVGPTTGPTWVVVGRVREVDEVAMRTPGGPHAGSQEQRSAAKGSSQSSIQQPWVVVNSSIRINLRRINTKWINRKWISNLHNNLSINLRRIFAIKLKLFGLL